MIMYNIHVEFFFNAMMLLRFLFTVMILSAVYLRGNSLTK